jgi:outer membrane protein OmpA-like peptidoglycan-associated protein
MKTLAHRHLFLPTLIAAVVSAVLLSACATLAPEPAGAAQARAKLTQLQSDPNLADRAPAAMKDADDAVRTAEIPERNPQLSAYRVYMADRKVDTARALAQTRYAEDQRTVIAAQQDAARLAARTREADQSRDQAAAAKAQGAVDKLAAQRALSDADAANLAAAASAQKSADLQQQASDLQQQLDAMQAKATDRGLVLTLGDVLFTTGKADLKPGATGNLNRLVAFLNKYPTRTVIIEGYTDSVGSADYNQGLSERRAGSVRDYLVGQGIDAARLTASGKGMSAPVADNGSAAGRQQNRRVEVIISNPALDSR